MPVHGNRSLKTGTLRNILRSIDMTPEDFLERFGKSSGSSPSAAARADRGPVAGRKDPPVSRDYAVQPTAFRRRIASRSGVRVFEVIGPATGRRGRRFKSGAMHMPFELKLKNLRRGAVALLVGMFLSGCRSCCEPLTADATW